MDSDKTEARWSWHLLLWVAPIAMGALFLIVMVTLAGGFEPFLFVFAAITVVTGLVGRRFPRRAGPITVLVVLALLVLMNLPSIIEDLGHPESFLNFAVFGIVLLALALMGITGSIAQLMSRSDAGATRVAYAGVGIMVVGIAVSAIAALTLEDDVAAAGDLEVVAEEVEFSPTALSGSGTIGVFIENKDPVRHTFTIESLDIEVELPASTNRRVEISGAPGEYEFFCSVEGHDDMKGTLTIEG